jgi:hypothetical protein
MRSVFALALMFASASCATSSPSSVQWSRIEGCWTERWADHWPAHMTWRRDPENPQRYLGHWRREAAQGDLEEVQFVLMPSGDHMQLCQSFAGGGRCDRAVFGRAGWRKDAVAVFDVYGDGNLEFGYAGAALPFFNGRGGRCE